MKVLAFFLLLAEHCLGETSEYQNSLDIKDLSSEIEGLRENIEDDLQSLQSVANIGHAERSIMYNYIDESIANFVKPFLEALRELRNNTERNLARVEESLKVNFELVKTKTAVNEARMIEGMVTGNDSALTRTAETLRARDKSVEVTSSPCFT